MKLFFCVFSITMTSEQRGKLEGLIVPNELFRHMVFKLYSYVCIENIALAMHKGVPD